MEAKKTPAKTYHVASFEFGYAMFAAAGSFPWSDQKRDAHTYDDRDNAETKLNYYRALAKSQGLDPAKVRIVGAA